MKTEIVAGSEIHLAAKFLKEGIPIVFPTETVYGLGAPVFQQDAVLKIFAIKNRPPDNPLIVHIEKLQDAALLSRDLPPLFETLAARFWPGPLTLVLKRSLKVPSIVSAGLDSIAIRMPAHPIALDLIRAVGEPIAAPSANLSGRPSPTNAIDVLEDLVGKVPLILDGGDSSLGIESTVISLLDEEPKLLRPGSISKEEIEDAIKQPISQGNSFHSPGMKYRHYAPRATVKLVMGKEELKGPFILRELSAKTLYREFRKADRSGAAVIEIDCSPDLLKDAALMNRLLMAAEKEPPH